MLQLNSRKVEGAFCAPPLFILLFLFLSPAISVSGQCDGNLVLNGSFTGEVSSSTDADGWTSGVTDPDINGVEDLSLFTYQWSQDPLPSNDGGTWQNIATDGEFLEQYVILVPGIRYLLSFEFTTHEIIRNETDPWFTEKTGVRVTIGNHIVETPIDTTPFSWESTCLSFIAENSENILKFEGSVPDGYLGIDGVCLIRDDSQQIIEDKQICIGDSILVNITGDFNSIIWNNQSDNSEFVIDAPGTYWVDIIDECGTYREEFDASIIDCGCKIYVPDIFNPNASGLDARFTLGTDCSLEEYELLVFDRWGNQVFVSTDVKLSWDGRIQHEEAISGVYFYKLTYDFLEDEKVTYGQINLIR